MLQPHGSAASGRLATEPGGVPSLVGGRAQAQRRGAPRRPRPLAGWTVGGGRRIVLVLLSAGRPPVGPRIGPAGCLSQLPNPLWAYTAGEPRAPPPIRFAPECASAGRGSRRHGVAPAPLRLRERPVRATQRCPLGRGRLAGRRVAGEQGVSLPALPSRPTQSLHALRGHQAREVLGQTGGIYETEEANLCQGLKSRIKKKWVPVIDLLVATTNKGDGYQFAGTPICR